MAGRKKAPTQVIVAKPCDLYPLPGQQIQTPPPSGKKDIMLAIITKDGRHISSYAINAKRFKRLEAENYWVLKKQNIKEN